MSISAKIILDKRYESKNGFNISISVSGFGKHKRIPTGYRSSKEDWDHGVLPSHPEYKKTKRFLLERNLRLDKEVEFCNDNRLNFGESLKVIDKGVKDRGIEITILENRLMELRGDAGKDFFEFWEEFREEMLVEGKSVRSYDESVSYFRNYLLEGIKINDITYELLKKFRTYKLSDGCGEGGISTYLRRLKTIFLEAQKRESLRIKGGNPFKGLISDTVASEIVEMDRDEMEAFMSFEPNKFASSNNAFVMKRRIAIWLFQFYIGGHDMVDVAALEWSNIQKGRVRFKRYKNRKKKQGGALIDNVLVPEALEIIKQYGTKKDKRVFGFIPRPDIEQAYSGYRRNTNRALRKVSEGAGLRHVMKSKSPRYIFRTWAAEEKCDFLSTKIVQGHKVQDVSSKYLAGFSRELADEVIHKVVYKSGRS